MTRSKLPLLVVVSGIPGAGKSTVGRMIADHYDATLLDKDDFLEDLFDNSNAPRHELSRKADELFLTAITHEPRVVAVSFWRRPELSETSGTPTDRFPTDRQVIEVWCDCPIEVAHERFFSRSRHPRHGDADRNRAETLNQLRQVAGLGPVGIGRLVRVNTANPLDPQSVNRLVGLESSNQPAR